MGRFQTGLPRPENAGRKKGIPNKKTLVLKDVFEQLGHDVPAKIAGLIPQLHPEKQVDVYLELMEYLYPKRKAVEHSGPVGGPIEIVARREDLKRIISDPEAFAAFETIEAKLQHETKE